ncbi:YafY family protein [Microbacterium sp. C7(2022)]|uniref:helix-turn-helix transcriptional regulator n=1 Tax=Microbacterium sp. C7(2022) TaxID=2992759 RepID=UPI00237B1B54|nr:WYL domain-containing protein [Microbacterium sp. C7(2022)]MDE0545596.1 WYL domain-containing protein [Microbacterium sp. C7(2022)]
MSEKPTLVATDRAALMLQLVPYLVARGEVSVEQAAVDFDVTPEAMRAMVEKLTVIGRPGDGGFWQMPNDLFDIDWTLLDEQDRIALTNTVGLERSPKLTTREAAALLAGLQLARSLPGIGDSDVFTGLLAKLARGASGAPVDVIVAPGPVDHAREVVAQALKDGVAVSFTYKAPDASATTRTVDPVKVQIADGQWYLQGWCHLRKAMRTFHFDRVSDLSLTEMPVSHSGDVSAWFDASDDDLTATVRFPLAEAPLLGEYLARAEVNSRGAMSEATMRVADELSLRRLATRRGGAVEIVRPPAARAAAAEWASAGLDQYR